MAYDKPEYARNPKLNKDGLTKKQAIFVENALEVGKDKAAEMAYPDATPRSQGLIADENLRNPTVLLSLGEKAERRGLSLNSGIDAIKKGLDEENPQAYLKAAELTLKIHGHLQDNKVAIPIPVSKEQYLELCRTFWTTKPA